MKTKTILGMILLATVISPIIGWSGNEGKGGFTSFYAKELLNISTHELLALMEDVDHPMFKTHPERRALIINALENMEIVSTETRSRDGEELFLDYDTTTHKIIVLKAFFDAFKVALVDPYSKELVKRMLLHEVAHLWDFSDTEAEVFAKEVLKSPITISYEPFSNGLENICSNLKIITSKKYDGLDAQSCYQAVTAKYCAEQNPFNLGGSSKEVFRSNSKIALELSKDLGSCRFSYWSSLVDSTRKRSEVLEWTLLNLSSDFTTQAVSSLVGLSEEKWAYILEEAKRKTDEGLKDKINDIMAIPAISEDIVPGFEKWRIAFNAAEPLDLSALYERLPFSKTKNRYGFLNLDGSSNNSYPAACIYFSFGKVESKALALSIITNRGKHKSTFFHEQRYYLPQKAILLEKDGTDWITKEDLGTFESFQKIQKTTFRKLDEYLIIKKEICFGNFCLESEYLEVNVGRDVGVL